MECAAQAIATAWWQEPQLVLERISRMLCGLRLRVDGVTRALEVRAPARFERQPAIGFVEFDRVEASSAPDADAVHD